MEKLYSHLDGGALAQVAETERGYKELTLFRVGELRVAAALRNNATAENAGTTVRILAHIISNPTFRIENTAWVETIITALEAEVSRFSTSTSKGSDCQQLLKLILSSLPYNGPEEPESHYNSFEPDDDMPAPEETADAPQGAESEEEYQPRIHLDTAPPSVSIEHSEIISRITRNAQTMNQLYTQKEAKLEEARKAGNAMEYKEHKKLMEEFDLISKRREEWMKRTDELIIFLSQCGAAFIELRLKGHYYDRVGFQFEPFKLKSKWQYVNIDT